jgi:hypothetical protein
MHRGHDLWLATVKWVAEANLCALEHCHRENTKRVPV